MSSFRKIALLAQQKQYPDYLCFEALEDGFVVSFSGSGLYYSLDRESWFPLATPESTTPPIQAGKRIWFKGVCPMASNTRGTFITSHYFKASGKLTSIIYGDDFEGKQPSTDYDFARLFAKSKLAEISDDFLYYLLPARGFYSAFEYSQLTYARINTPIFGTTTVFSGAFANSALEKVDIVTTFLTIDLFVSAFKNTRIQSLYLPSKKWASGAYSNIARDCGQLKSVRIDSLALGTYQLNYAFYNCLNLSSVVLMSTTALGEAYTNYWLRNVSETGVIALNKNIDWDPETLRNGLADPTTGKTITWGIPAGWTIRYCDPDNPSDIRDYKW